MIVIASNRGPVSWRDGPEGLTSRRGGGGLVSALSAMRLGTEAHWVCAAMTPGDREAVRQHLSHDGVTMLAIDPLTFDRAYNGIANGLLWFTSHLLQSTPAFDAQDWQAFTAYAEAFAQAIDADAPPGATVLVQDYHLSLVPALLRARRPDLRISHFSHTPWAPPEYFRLLPRDVAVAVLRGLLGSDAVGFLSPRWADAFGACCVDLLQARYDGTAVHQGGRSTRVDVHPLGVDGASLRAQADGPEVLDRMATIRDLVGDRQLILRVDRTELSKNIVRGLEAYRELLLRYPEHRGRVVHLVLAYPSRHELAEYREYTDAIRLLAAQINDEVGTADWQPVVLEVRDDYAKSLAAMRLADVLLVNPVRDGMNLVAKEGPVLSDAGLSLVLSTEAGAADELGPWAHLVAPRDVSATADALHAALSDTDRVARTHALATAATAMPPAAWLQAQIDALK